MNIKEVIIDYDHPDANWQPPEHYDAEHAFKLSSWNPKDLDEEALFDAYFESEEIFAVHVQIDKRMNNFKISVYAMTEPPPPLEPDEQVIHNDDGSTTYTFGVKDNGYDKRAFIISEMKVNEISLSKKDFKDDWEEYLVLINEMYNGGINRIDKAEFGRGRVHEDIAYKLSEKLSEAGLKNVRMNDFVSMLREYHFLHVEKPSRISSKVDRSPKNNF